MPRITAVNGNKLRVIAGFILPVAYEHKLVYVEFQVIDENCTSDVIVGCSSLGQLGFELHDGSQRAKIHLLSRTTNDWISNCFNRRSNKGDENTDR